MIWIQITLLVALYIISLSQLFYITSDLFKKDIKEKVDFILSKKNYRIIPPIYLIILHVMPLMPQPRIEPIFSFITIGIMQYDFVIFFVGWALLIIGAALLIASAVMKDEAQENS